MITFLSHICAKRAAAKMGHWGRMGVAGGEGQDIK